ncbi:MAG: flagellar motor switch protein FliG, partial [Gemmatimonadales bacterium]|nr:flagellar motor switch protein FliG [Gemmatimonadales bacterium]
QAARASTEQVADGGINAARALLEATIGTERARGVVERIKSPPPPSGLAKLARVTPEALIGILRGEQPQTVALVLAHLEPRLAAGVVEALPPAFGTEVVYRMARLGPVTPEVLAEVERSLSSRTDLAFGGGPAATGGPAAVARVLTMVQSATGNTLLEAVATRGADLASQIRDLMFVFEDLQLLDDRSMQRLLRDVPSRELALGLKAASEPLKAHVFKNMSERAVEALQEEMEILGAVKVKDVQAAHATIIATARELQEAGEITVDRGGSEDTIA